MSDAEDEGGIAARLGRLADGVLATLQTRLALLAVEVDEEGVRLGRALFYVVVAALFAGFGLFGAAAFMTVWLWETHRLLALGAGSVTFLAAALLAAARARAELRRGSQLFRDSIAELARDREALSGRRE